ncbi:MAG: type II toxin-antitoxin system RelE/ParE family toxin [Candidatus Thermoplasmatota archaeon]
MKGLDAAPIDIQRKIRALIPGLEVNPRTPRSGFDCKRLAGRGDLWRVRVGTWRILYAVDDGVKVVLVTRVGRRGTVYG